MVQEFRVGVITSTHGLKGEVKVFPTTEEPRRYDSLKDVLIYDGRRYTPARIRSVRYFKQMVIVAFEGKDTIEDIQPWLKKEIYVSRENALPLEEGGYYLADIIGMTVIDEEGKTLGTLTDVLETGANDVYIVDMNGKEVLIPAIPQCILKVDLESNCVTVHLLEGLI